MSQGRLGGLRAWGVALLLVVGGCATPPPVKSPPLDFAGRGVIALDVASIRIVDQYRPLRTKPHVDHLAPTPPNVAVRRWVGERLRAAGNSGSVDVIIKDASIIETELPRTEGVKALFTRDQSQRYEGRIEVQIVAHAPGRLASGYAQAAASRSTTVPEDISLAGREETWNTLVREMVNDLDDRLERGIHEGLGPLVVQR